MPTLNAFDNGDIRTTVIIFYGNRVDDVRLQDSVINTLQARMGTGGNNMPMVATIPIHDKATRFAGRRKLHDGTYSDDGAGNGLGIGKEGDPMNTLTGGDRHAVFESSNVRRLTPVECERLQGFPDDWTAGQSDSARYKQMGNAVAVPVVEWLIQNIVDVANVS
jgi:DNA (cytosine-5)-methyltransferase 1